MGGIVLVAVGGVWIAQGSGRMYGSVMTGGSRYTALCVVALLLEVALIAWAWGIRSGRR